MASTTTTKGVHHRLHGIPFHAPFQSIIPARVVSKSSHKMPRKHASAWPPTAVMGTAPAQTIEPLPQQLSDAAEPPADAPGYEQLSNCMLSILSRLPACDGQSTSKKICTSCRLGRRMVVVGAGPAGTVTAMLLAKRGYTVEVFERRGRPSRALAATLHSYILALTPR